MPRYFNTGGPCKGDIHYMLSSGVRLPRVRGLVEQKSYFVLHGPGRVGKTTGLMALGQALTAEGRYAALLVSMESGAAFPDDMGAAEDAILDSWGEAALSHLPEELRPPPWPAAAPGARIRKALAAWARACPRPLVVFLDEIDTLQGEVLLSVLRQLRDGHKDRPASFPWALALVGMRDVRDYKIASGGSDRLHTSSPFNIKLESLTMREFTAGEVAELYAQHTADTGQAFEPSAVARAFELTLGQPWLVNALARQAVEELVPDRSIPISVAVIDAAKDELIRRQDTHLDSLAERLREARVRAVIEPILAGGELAGVPDDDLRLVVDLGLVRESSEGGFTIANPIYREVIPTVLGRTARASLPRIEPSWLLPGGGLDVGALAKAFVTFWLEHGELLQGTAPYLEIAPHLVLMAFLHRVVNGGGRVEREYALGRRRLDLLVDFGGEHLAIEVKTWRDVDDHWRREPVADGLKQVEAYAARASATAVWLVVFDQRPSAPHLLDRARTEQRVAPGGRAVTVIML